jgi:hypothetical protein
MLPTLTAFLANDLVKRIRPKDRRKLAAQAWLQPLPELQGMSITAGWDALGG